MRTRVVIAAVAAAFGLVALSGCGERPQAVAYKQGKYQGKPDTRPWDNTPLAYGGPKWNKGDKASWEEEIKTRNRTQNENVRIGE